MRYDFSAHFLRIDPPETTFGGAWESLCFDLLCAEHGPVSLVRLNAPDRGLDIQHVPSGTAYQCKSTQDGQLGSIPPDESVSSLQTAYKARDVLKWVTYLFATNANYSGVGQTRIRTEATTLGLSDTDLGFRGPEFWEDLCTKHHQRVIGRFDYRVSASEMQVIESLRSAGYYDRFVKQYAAQIGAANYPLSITNNLTPLTLTIPFAPDLKVETCVDVAQNLLGISLKWTNFPDLGTSAGPSISLTLDGRAQGFSKVVHELAGSNGKQLQLWVTVVWKDEIKREGVDAAEVQTTLLRRCSRYTEPRSPLVAVFGTPGAGGSMSLDERRRETIRRAQNLIQAMIWAHARNLCRP